MTNFSTIPNTVRLSLGFFWSLVSTVMFLFILFPPYPLVYTFMVIFPSPPGRICLVYETAVQPQPVLTFLISRGAVPLFCMIKSCNTSVPSKTRGNAYWVSGKKAVGALRVLSWAPKEPVAEKSTQNARAKTKMIFSLIGKILYLEKSFFFATKIQRHKENNNIQ